MHKEEKWITKFRRIFLTEREYENVSMYGKNMKKIFQFIDQNYDHGRKDFGNAYYEIRTRATRKIDLRVSKREVRAIICYPRFIIEKFKYIAIPYKINIIIETILEILDELEKMGESLPSDLIQFKNRVIRDCFYGEQYETFMNWRRIQDELLDVDSKLEANLNNQDSAINSIFKYN